MFIDRETASQQLGHVVTALPECDGALIFADLIDSLRDSDAMEDAISDMECLITAEIPGMSPEGMERLIKLVDSSLRYCILINDELDAGRIEYLELA